jgi:hypothetical protein
MCQLPLLPTIRIRRPFQRDREPHGQYWIDAAKEVSLATRNKRSTQGKRTFHIHYITQGGNGQPRAVIIQADSVLTEMKVVGWCPEISAINDHEMERER